VRFLAYSPLGRGLLTGRWRSRADFTADDYRLFSPRFAEGALERNHDLVERVAALAARKRCTPAQLAPPGCCTGEDIVPIPEPRAGARLEENAAAASFSLSTEDLAAARRRAAPPGFGRRRPLSGSHEAALGLMPLSCSR
jgi:aryl-alcohol dehydrogenase-like predicted oxidoreductase